MEKLLVNARARTLHALREAKKWSTWTKRNFEPPLPDAAKHGVMRRHSWPDGTWIETGTYFGDTTARLGRTGVKVFSIEADPALARKATDRFRNQDNVTIFEGDSAKILPGLLNQIQGPVNFWLDGHYSGGVTHKDYIDTPIRAELGAISAVYGKDSPIAVLVDDFRCFTSVDLEYADYPDQGFLVAWAESMDLWWTIEHDIFVAKSRTLV